jgi:hypothetical protein
LGALPALPALPACFAFPPPLFLPLPLPLPLALPFAGVDVDVEAIDLGLLPFPAVVGLGCGVLCGVCVFPDCLGVPFLAIAAVVGVPLAEDCRDCLREEGRAGDAVELRAMAFFR